MSGDEFSLLQNEMALAGDVLIQGMVKHNMHQNRKDHLHYCITKAYLTRPPAFLIDICVSVSSTRQGEAKYALPRLRPGAL